MDYRSTVRQNRAPYNSVCGAEREEQEEHKKQAPVPVRKIGIFRYEPVRHGVTSDNFIHGSQLLRPCCVRSWSVALLPFRKSLVLGTYELARNEAVRRLMTVVSEEVIRHRTTQLQADRP